MSVLEARERLIEIGAAADTSSITRSNVATTLAAIPVAATPASASAHACGPGDPPLQASSRTSCGLAATVLDRVYRGALPGRARTISVRSPVTHKRYRIRLVRRGNFVTGSGRNGIWVHFYYDGR